MFGVWFALVWFLTPFRPRFVLELEQWRYIITISSDRSKVVVSAGGWIGPLELWDTVNGRILARFAEFRSHIVGVAFSPDDKLLALADERGTMNLWDIQRRTGRAVPQFTHVSGLRFSPDGRFLFIDAKTSTSPAGVHLWDVRDERERSMINISLRQTEFLNGDRKFVTWKYDRDDLANVELWKLDDDGATMLHRQRFETTPVVISPNGEKFAMVRRLRPEPRQWRIEVRDSRTHDSLAEFVIDCKDDYVPQTAFSAGGNILYTIADTTRNPVVPSLTTTLWDLRWKSHRFIGSFPLDVVVSPDEKWIAIPTSVGADLFLLDTMQLTTSMTNPHDRNSSVHFLSGGVARPSVYFSPDRSMVAISSLNIERKPSGFQRWFLRASASGGEVRGVRLWSVATGEEVYSIEGTFRQFSSDGKTIVMGEGSSTNRAFWDVPLRKPFARILFFAFLGATTTALVFRAVRTDFRKKFRQNLSP